jgi:Fe-S-cluster-containing dehydrogenase component
VLARCRDGRPVKLEGNELSPIGSGGLCAAGQASVLELYDSHRPEGPLARGARPATWSELDAAVMAELEKLRTGGRVRLLTGTIHSPSTLAAIERFLARFADARHVAYDALSVSAVLDAHERTHGVRALPAVRFDRASVIASFDCDFLGTWIAPVQFARDYASRRTGEGRSLHVQLESRVSLAGTRADRRVLLAPHEIRRALEALCADLAGRAGSPQPRPELEARVAQTIERLADELWRARGESLVVCGANDFECQVLVNEVNWRLGNYGRTLDLDRPSLQRRGDDRALESLAGELERGEVDLLVVAGCNPAYDAPGLARAFGRARVRVACSQTLDETARDATWVAPQPHYLEAWDDAEPVAGRFGLTQPTIPALRESRTLRRTLGAWMGDARGERELVADHWREAIWPRLGSDESFEAFFRRALHDGAAQLPDAAAARPVAEFRGRGEMRGERPKPAGPTLVLYPKVGLLDGAHAGNPWLQELPDPITKATWGNYVCVAPSFAKREGLSDGDVVRVSADGVDGAVELPVYVQRGQHEDVVAIALGYGRAGTERFAGVGPRWIGAKPTVEPGKRVGESAAPFLAVVNGLVRADVRSARVERTGARCELARTQDYDSLELPAKLAPHGHEERDHVRTAGEGEHAHEKAAGSALGMWSDDHANSGPRWGMVIDLERCTGCSACVVACQAENNVPVVGRDEVLRHREMHWLRVDRYFGGPDEELRTDHQPMLCQHCAHAPCEAVCPVLATVHSAEGLNQQVYNRCVGTRYCANTCPYKVRRFNWFEYAREDELENHVLNPDVTVRSRGVMEKCSFCVQRIQEAKLEARRTGEKLPDGAVRTACQQSCPAEAIRFGDMKQPDGEAARGAADPRSYVLLEELNVRPSIHYMARERHAGQDGVARQEHNEEGVARGH